MQLNSKMECQRSSFKKPYVPQGCALAEPGGPWRLTFALGRLENLRFFIQIICWAPQILQFQSTGLPSIFLRAQPCTLGKLCGPRYQLKFQRHVIKYGLNWIGKTWTGLIFFVIKHGLTRRIYGSLHFGVVIVD